MTYVQKQHEKKKKPFQENYLFKIKNIVVLECDKAGGFIQVKPNNLDLVDGKGNKDEYSQWEANPTHVGGNTYKVTFKSVKTGKYLRLKDNVIDAKGGQDEKYCVFKRKWMNNKNKLFSGVEDEKDYDGKSIASINQGIIMVGGGGSYANINIYREN